MSNAHSWTTLDPPLLDAWVRARTSAPPPVIYHLAPPLMPAALQAPFGDLPNLSRRSDSGIAELIIQNPLASSLESPFDLLQAPILAAEIQDVVSLARQEDPDRMFGDREQPDPRSAFWEYRSLIPLPSIVGEPTPVIGPGGRITIASTSYRGEPVVEVSLVVRRRLTSFPSAWRPVDEILRSVRWELESTPSNIKVHAAFGMFELSKYEQQRVLRPAFVFVLTSEESSDFRVPWQYTIVEAATKSPNLPPEEGLGSWATQQEG